MLACGAGPTGLACAIEAQKAGFRAVNIDKGACYSLYNYPANMTFFTTRNCWRSATFLHTAHQKPTRSEALEYIGK
jgi:thioredoxin reductase (NADPH)